MDLRDIIVRPHSARQIFRENGIPLKSVSKALNLSYNLLALIPTSLGNCINLEELYIESNFLPIEFNEFYDDYLDLQEFLAPFQQTWIAMNNPIEDSDSFAFNPDNMEPEVSEYEVFIDEEFKKAFSNIEDM